jgi:UDP-GlcNAc3NAcA epimerase
MVHYNIATVVGARPQFVKAAVVSSSIQQFNKENPQSKIVESLIHTGQHYDDAMSEVFFRQLQIPSPAINLEVGSGPHGQQTARILEAIERYLCSVPCDAVLVYGDTNSTLSGALAAAKLKIPIIHVEAGLRSFSKWMPEEINRVITDRLSDLLLCPTENSVSNLANEGITQNTHHVGDVMYDAVTTYKKSPLVSTSITQLVDSLNSYAVVTIHRADNTDSPSQLLSILNALDQLSLPVVWPIHPRTKKLIPRGWPTSSSIHLLDPISYVDMLRLLDNSDIALTDSGGLQKEAYWTQTPCVTLRNETEWGELVDSGLNIIAGSDSNAISKAARQASNIPQSLFENQQQILGSPGASDRVVDCIYRFLESRRS